MNKISELIKEREFIVNKEHLSKEDYEKIAEIEIEIREILANIYAMVTLIDKKPKGKWEKFTCMDFVREEEILKCNKCDWLNGDNFEYNYCPNCGAEMEVK